VHWAHCPISLGPDPHAPYAGRGGGTLEIETANADDRDDTARTGHAPVTIAGLPADANLTEPGIRLMPDCRVPTTLRPVAVAFIVFGFFAGAWAVATVDIERTFGLGDAALGALLAAGIIAATAVAAIGGAAP